MLSGLRMHCLATYDPIRVEIILQNHYVFNILIYKLVISDKILVFIVTHQVSWHPVTGLAYGSVLIYIVLMRW